MAETYKPPGDIIYLEPWFNLIRAARAEAVPGRPTVITIKAYLDREGNPVLWPHIEACGIEPRGRAEMVLADLAAHFAP
jgi:hypothetical protein